VTKTPSFTAATDNCSSLKWVIMTGVLCNSELNFFHNNDVSMISYPNDEDIAIPDFWSSFSVVESLFKDEKISPYSVDVLNEEWSDDEPLDGSNHSSSPVAPPFCVERRRDSRLILQLPTNIALQILGFLSAKDLAHLEQVCKKLVPVSTENALWKELYMKRWKLLELGLLLSESHRPTTPKNALSYERNSSISSMCAYDDVDSDSGQDEWAWIYSLLQQNERWKDIYRVRYSAEQWRIGTLKMFNGCWGFISQVPEDGNENGNSAIDSSYGGENYTALDIFFHRKDICPDGAWYEDWWLQDTPGVSRSQKCGYWDTFLYGRKVRYKQRAAYAQGRRPQACQISFLDQDRPAREFNLNEIISNGLTAYSVPNIPNGMSVNGQGSGTLPRNRLENGRTISMGEAGIHNGSPISGQKIRHHGSSSPKGRIISYLPTGDNGLYTAKRSSNYAQGQPSHSSYSFMRRR